MYKAQASPCDICSACGETLTHCWAPLLPGAEYSVLAAYSIQTQHCGNQVDITLRYGVIPRYHACPLPWVTQIRAKASKDKVIQPQVVHREKGLQLKVLY